MEEYTTTVGRSKPGAMPDGAILAGGASRRMGRDKLFLRFGARTALERVSEAMTPLVGRLRVVGRAPSAELPEAQPDLYPGLGPLAGVHAALATALSDRVLVVACDFPLVTTSFLQALLEALTPNYDAVVPSPAGEPLAVCAVYRVTCAPEAARRLDRGELAIRDFAKSLHTRFLGDRDLSRLDPSGSCLLNVNTPQDVDRVQKLVENESKT